MQDTVRHWLDELQPAFREAGDAHRAVGEKAYLKSDLEFVGCGVPFIRSTAKGFRRQFPKLPREEVIEVVRMLWQPPVHELRSLAIALLEVYRDRLDPADVPLIEEIVRECNTWAHVDWLAAKVAGFLLDRSPERDAVLERWSRDDWMWLRRTALLAHLEALREGHGDFEGFSRLAARMLGEREFFIRKAIGWVLRDMSRRRPELAYRFLDAHLKAVSGLTLREGAKHLPKAQREELMARHKRRRAPTEA